MSVTILADKDEVPYTETNKLHVEAQLVVGDIQIGSVEIKDAESDARQKVKSDGIDNASVVMINSRMNFQGLGDKIIGTTEVPLVFSGTTFSVRIRADISNIGLIYIGKTGVLSDGSNDFIRLAAGDELTLEYNDIDNHLYVISNIVSQKINVGALL